MSKPQSEIKKEFYTYLSWRIHMIATCWCIMFRKKICGKWKKEFSHAEEERYDHKY